MILTCREMKALEERTFADGVTAEALMEEAGRKIAQAVRQFSRGPGTCVVHFGKGHNGGDALVAARHLAQAGWTLEWKPAFPEDTWAPLTRKNWERAQEKGPPTATGPNVIPDGPPSLVVLDGLLGIGAGGALREPIRTATQEINRLRATSGARVFALDLPTGLDADTGVADPDTVVSDYTLTVGFAKQGLLADAATRFVGRLAVLPLDELTKRATAGNSDIVATPDNLRPTLPRRNFDTHKGQCGRVADRRRLARLCRRVHHGLGSLCPRRCWPHHPLRHRGFLSHRRRRHLSRNHGQADQILPRGPRGQIRRHCHRARSRQKPRQRGPPDP
jgi:hydroxyethylthiazole kinase-like uncharacterized protein yjeF